jgi:hypothetical protein
VYTGVVDYGIKFGYQSINQSMTPIYLVVSIHHEQDPSELTMTAPGVHMGQG